MKLGIFRSSVSGFVQGKVKFHEVVRDEKLGNLIIPATEEDYTDLIEGAATHNVPYKEMTPEELEVAGLDLRVYKIITKEKVEAVLSLNAAEQLKIIKILNENLSELLEAAGKPIAKIEEDAEKKKEEEEKVTINDFTVAELIDLLEDNGIKPPNKANKQALYDLAFPPEK